MTALKKEITLLEHWRDVKEVGGSSLQLKFMLFVASYMPVFIIEVLTALCSFFFWLFAHSVRKRSKIYLKHVFCKKHLPLLSSYKHVYSFAFSMMEKLLCYKGKINSSKVTLYTDDASTLSRDIENGNGALLLCFHLGNIELLRALSNIGKARVKKDFCVVPLVDFSGTSKFNNLLFELNPHLMRNVLNVNDITVETSIYMKELLNKGNLIAVAGDRISANTRKRTLATEFLGDLALFPEGSFTLPFILGVPVYFIWAVRKREFDINSGYEMHVIKAKTNVFCPRQERHLKMRALLNEYVQILERECHKHPYQWYNFYNFWER